MEMPHHIYYLQNLVPPHLIYATSLTSLNGPSSKMSFHERLALHVEITHVYAMHIMTSSYNLNSYYAIEIILRDICPTVGCRGLARLIHRCMIKLSGMANKCSYFMTKIMWQYGRPNDSNIKQQHLIWLSTELYSTV